MLTVDDQPVAADDEKDARQTLAMTNDWLEKPITSCFDISVYKSNSSLA